MKKFSELKVGDKLGGYTMNNEGLKIRLQEAKELIETIEKLEVGKYDYNCKELAQLDRTLKDIRIMSVKTVENIRNYRMKKMFEKR